MFDLLSEYQVVSSDFKLSYNIVKRISLINFDFLINPKIIRRLALFDFPQFHTLFGIGVHFFFLGYEFVDRGYRAKHKTFFFCLKYFGRSRKKLPINQNLAVKIKTNKSVLIFNQI
jgi:hypothetical protein